MYQENSIRESCRRLTCRCSIMLSASGGTMAIIECKTSNFVLVMVVRIHVSATVVGRPFRLSMDHMCCSASNRGVRRSVLSRIDQACAHQLRIIMTSSREFWGIRLHPPLCRQLKPQCSANRMQAMAGGLRICVNAAIAMVLAKDNVQTSVRLVAYVQIQRIRHHKRSHNVLQTRALRGCNVSAIADAMTVTRAVACTPIGVRINVLQAVLVIRVVDFFQRIVLSNTILRMAWIPTFKAGATCIPIIEFGAWL